MRRYVAIALAVAAAWCAGCDLLDTPRIVNHGGSGKDKPRDLSAPDSVLKMVEYLFDQHTPQAAEDYGDLLYDGYIYRYEDPTDQNDLLLDKASEVRVYERIFGFYDDISAQFIVHDRWNEYGSAQDYPEDTPPAHISDAHPDETWVILNVRGDMSFTNTDDKAERSGYTVDQYFDIAFRRVADPDTPTWQIASWTDRDAILGSN